MHVLFVGFNVNISRALHKVLSNLEKSRTF